MIFLSCKYFNSRVRVTTGWSSLWAEWVRWYIMIYLHIYLYRSFLVLSTQSSLQNKSHSHIHAELLYTAGLQYCTALRYRLQLSVLAKDASALGSRDRTINLLVSGQQALSHGRKTTPQWTSWTVRTLSHLVWSRRLDRIPGVRCSSHLQIRRGGSGSTSNHGSVRLLCENPFCVFQTVGAITGSCDA